MRLVIVDKEAGKLSTLKYYCWCLEVQIEENFLEGFWQYLSRILHVAPFLQAILLLGIYPMEIFV